ncbi:MAG: hypothetical protein EOO11_18260 [Chitinophagaceae bacterium]|nr:MAG: hypothetical protein EOO11_18260 [Chitinophagaceae bacterium]
MKVRIQGNSIRFRLKEPEVHRFSQTGFVEESMNLGAGTALRFRLEAAGNGSVELQHRANAVTILVPQTLATDWTGTDRVGFDAAIDLGDGARLNVLVEKDWACLDGSEEENIGSYPNPMTQC